jgi:membrane protein
MRAAGELITATVREWWNDRAPQLSAALAFYTIFSLAPILLIAVAIASLVFDSGTAREAIMTQLREYLGPHGVEVVSVIFRYARERSPLATGIGLGAALFGATVALVQLQDALNLLWGVPPPRKWSITHFLRKRLWSLTAVLLISALLLASVIASTAISVATRLAPAWAPLSPGLLRLVEIAVSVIMMTILFGLILKILPEVRLAWGDVWPGALVTSLLFSGGKYLIGLYLAYSSVGSLYGAAGSFVVFLVWIYYSIQVFFLGAEFTKIYTRRFGSHAPV